LNQDSYEELSIRNIFEASAYKEELVFFAQNCRHFQPQSKSNPRGDSTL